MPILTRMIYGRSSVRDRIPRRLVWAMGSHRLLGLFALDPAGNVVFRFGEDGDGPGAWVRAQALDGGQTFPLARRAVPKLIEKATGKHVRAAPSPSSAPEVAAKQAAEEARADATKALGAGCYVDPMTGVLRIDPRVKFWRFRAQLSKLETWGYKAFFYVAWVVGLFGAWVAYLRLKTEVCGYHLRQRLNALEAALADLWRQVLRITERQLRDLGVPAGWVDDGDAFLREAGHWLYSGAVRCGYDASVNERDRVRAATEVKVSTTQQRGESRRVVYWTVVAWIMSAAALLLVFLL